MSILEGEWRASRLDGGRVDSNRADSSRAESSRADSSRDAHASHTGARETVR